MGKLRAFAGSRTAATAIEYGLIIGALAAAAAATMPTIGGELSSAFGKLAAALAL